MYFGKVADISGFVGKNGGLAAGGKKIFFKLLRLGKLDKFLIHQIVKRKFPFPPTAQLQNYIYGCVMNDNLAKGLECVLDMRFVGFIFGHGNSPFLIIVRDGSTPCCRPLIAYLQRRASCQLRCVCAVHPDR